MSRNAHTVNTMLRDVQALRSVGCEELYAVAIVEGRPVRFAVVAVSRGDTNQELVLELDRRTWEGPHR